MRCWLSDGGCARNQLLSEAASGGIGECNGVCVLTASMMAPREFRGRTHPNAYTGTLSMGRIEAHKVCGKLALLEQGQRIP